MYTYKGKRALITGASTGIGASFARALAKRGMNLVLVARSEDKMRRLASELSAANGVSIEVIAADLRRPDAAQTLYEATRQKGLTIDLLVNNAGFSTYGNFETISGDKEQEEIAVNIASLVALTHAFVPQMLEKGEGAILNVASNVGFFALPRQAVYAASKAFVLSFSEALYAEYRKRGVRVFALCPGAVATEFFDEIQADVQTKAATPEQVVEVGLRAFEQGRHYVIPGAMNTLQSAILPRFLPRGFMVRTVDTISQRVIRPRTATR